MPKYSRTKIEHGLILTWGPFTTADRSGNWAKHPQYPGKNVRTYGVFGAAAAISMKTPAVASSALSAETDITLNDSRGEGNPAILGDANCLELNENPDQVAPYLTGGDGDTAVYVVMTCIG
jgi:hypothetical protein